MTSKKVDLRTKLLSNAATKHSRATSTSSAEVSSYSQGYKAHLTVTKAINGTRISFSHDLYLRNLLEWNDALWKIGRTQSLELDFSSTKFFTPLSLLFIPHQIRAFYKRYPEVRLHIVGHQHLAYPAHMGFFDSLGGDFGKTMGEASGDRNYLPISIINVSQFIKNSGSHNVRDSIDSETKRLAYVLIRTNKGIVFDLVQYSLREIIRNVFEHSGSKICMYCAQYWPSKNRVQICIVDDGSGIHSSLTFNPKFKDLSERDAVHFSLLPGVSGNFRDLRLGEGDSIWRNSGYGLYMTSRMCRNNGGFRIISSNHAIALVKGQKTISKAENFRGTMITMDLIVESQTDLSKRLEEYAAEGKMIARDIQGANVIEASAASQMLSRDFAKPR